MTMDPGLQLDLLMRVAVAVALSAIIGLERELNQEQAGLRTHALVGLGAAGFTVTGSIGFAGDFDPTRIAAGIVTGIGFIGAGTILRGEGAIRGLSTAASLWSVGAIGMACGAGLFVFGAGLTVLALFVLEVLDRIERAVLHGRVPPPSGPESVDIRPKADSP
jgi:putative Mg2+ transporter-C (MgtC) family protein